MIHQYFYNVKKISISEPIVCDQESGPYFSRRLTIKTADGEIEIFLFSGNNESRDCLTVEKIDSEDIQQREYLRQIIVERDEWRQRYLDMKHMYDEHVHGKQVAE